MPPRPSRERFPDVATPNIASEAPINASAPRRRRPGRRANARRLISAMGMNKPKVRLVAERAKAKTGEPRPAFQQRRAGGEQRGGEQGVLAGSDRPPQAGERQEHNQRQIAPDHAHREKTRHGGDRLKHDEREQIRQPRERRADQQKDRRIIEIIVSSGGSDGGLLSRMVCCLPDHRRATACPRLPTRRPRES